MNAGTLPDSLPVQDGGRIILETVHGNFIYIKPLRNVTQLKGNKLAAVVGHS